MTGKGISDRNGSAYRDTHMGMSGPVWVKNNSVRGKVRRLMEETNVDQITGDYVCSRIFC